MARWWCIAVLCYWIPLVAAVRFYGIPDTVDVGQSLSLLLQMEPSKGENSNPFDLVLGNTTVIRIITLQKITQVNLTFPVNVTLPSVPEGLYQIVATEPSSSQEFSRSGKFYIRNTPLTESSSTTPTISTPSASFSTPPHLAVETPQQTNHATTLVVVGVLCGILFPAIIVLFVVLYRRQRRLRRLVDEPHSIHAVEVPPSPPIPYTVGYQPNPRPYPTLHHTPNDSERHVQEMSPISDQPTSHEDVSNYTRPSLGYQPTEKELKLGPGMRTVRNWSDDPPPIYASNV